MSKEKINKLVNSLQSRGEAAEPTTPPVAEASDSVQIKTNKEGNIPKVEPDTSKKDHQVTPKKDKPDASKKDQADTARNKAIVKNKPIEATNGLTQFANFEELYNTINSEKDSFSFDNKKIVYVDGDIGDILDLLKKNGKINISTFVSYLLQQFILDHKGIVQELREKKENRFLD